MLSLAPLGVRGLNYGKGLTHITSREYTAGKGDQGTAHPQAILASIQIIVAAISTQVEFVGIVATTDGHRVLVGPVLLLQLG